MKRFLFAVVIVTGLMQGCGFHLRGVVTLPASVSVVHVSSTDQALQTQVEETLRISGAKVVPQAADATAVVNIADVKFGRTVRTIDTRGKVTGYLLSYTANFNVKSTAGKTLLDSEALGVERDYNYDSTQVLAKEGEEKFLRGEMERDVAQRIVRRLASVQ